MRWWVGEDNKIMTNKRNLNDNSLKVFTQENSKTNPIDEPVDNNINFYSIILISIIINKNTN